MRRHAETPVRDGQSHGDSARLRPQPSRRGRRSGSQVPSRGMVAQVLEATGNVADEGRGARGLGMEGDDGSPRCRRAAARGRRQHGRFPGKRGLSLYGDGNRAAERRVFLRLRRCRELRAKRGPDSRLRASTIAPSRAPTPRRGGSGRRAQRCPGHPRAPPSWRTRPGSR